MKHFSLAILMATLLIGTIIAPSRTSGQTADPSTQPTPAKLGLTATAVTLNYDKAPLKRVLDDLGRQMNTDLGQNEPPQDPFGNDTPLTIHLDHGSYWQALATIQLQPDVRLASSGQAVGMPLEDQPTYIGDLAKTHPQIEGPFYITSSQTTVNRFNNYGTVEVAGTNVGIRAVILSEPQVHILNWTGQHWLERCVDDRGNVLPAIPDEDLVRPIDYHDEDSKVLRTYGFCMEAGLVAPANLGAKIADLKGRLPVMIQTKSQAVEFDTGPNAAQQTKAFGAGSATLAKITTTPDGTFVDIVLRGAIFRQSPQTMRGVLSQVRFYASDDSICLASFGKIEAAQDGSTHVTLGVYPAPKTLRWEAPLEIRPMVIPFELHDLALTP